MRRPLRLIVLYCSLKPGRRQQDRSRGGVAGGEPREQRFDARGELEECDVGAGAVEVVYVPVLDALDPGGKVPGQQRAMLRLLDRDNVLGRPQVFFPDLKWKPLRVR